jgi:hypothetical protein
MNLYYCSNTDVTMRTLGRDKPVSLIDREMLEAVPKDERVNLGLCKELYIDNDVDAALLGEKVNQIRDVKKLYVPWHLYKAALKRGEMVGETIGYEGEPPIDTPGEKKDTTIKNLDAALFQRVKALATIERLTIGEAINEAMDLWLERKDQGYSSNKKMDLLRKLEELSDKKNREGMDDGVFQIVKNAYSKEIEKLDQAVGNTSGLLGEAMSRV